MKKETIKEIRSYIMIVLGVALIIFGIIEVSQNINVARENNDLKNSIESYCNSPYINIPENSLTNSNTFCNEYLDVK